MLRFFSSCAIALAVVCYADHVVNDTWDFPKSILNINWS